MGDPTLDPTPPDPATFAGNAPVSAPAFIVAQLVGALAAAGLGRWPLKTP